MSRRIQKRPFGLARSTAVGLCAVVALSLLTMTPVSTLAQDGRARSIEGPRWQLLEYRDESGRTQAVPPGIAVTALLWFETIAGDGACSAYDSKYTLQKETLIVDEPTVIRRGCDPEAQAIDDAFYRNLTEAASWSRDGSVLELLDPVGDQVMTFTEAVLPSDPTIAPWEVARVTNPDGSVGPVIQGSSPRVQFLRGGRLVGTTGCGWFVGSYTTNDTLMTITDISSRFDECTPDLRSQADNIINTLDEVSDFEVLPAGLTLADEANVTRMALVPSIALGRRTWTPIDILGPDGESLVVPARLLTSSVRFANDEADGRSLCRSYRSDSLRSGLALTVFDLVVDRKSGGCRKRARPKLQELLSQQDVENLYTDTLSSVASHALRGSELELMNATGAPVMRLVPQPDLVGVPWTVTNMDTQPRAAKEKLRPPILDAKITAVFDAGDVLDGHTGKNSYFGSYTTPRASKIDITDVLIAGQTCKGSRANRPLCRQETLFKGLLESADVYIVSPRGLTLLKGDRRVLEFERAVEPAASN